MCDNKTQKRAGRYGSLIISKVACLIYNIRQATLKYIDLWEGYFLAMRKTVPSISDT